MSLLQQFVEMALRHNSIASDNETDDVGGAETAAQDENVRTIQMVVKHG